MSSGTYDQSNLTKRQLMIWGKQKLLPDAPLFNMRAIFEFAGMVEHRHLAAAFQAVVDRSDALRTVVEEIDGVPRQRVLPHVRYALPYEDLAGEADPAAALAAWIAARPPLALDQRLFDGGFLRLAPDRFAWYLCQHHIVADAWSVALVYRRTAEYYDRAVAGTLDTAEPLPRYAAYLEFERRYRASKRCAGDGAYWERKLAQPAAPVALYGRVADRRSLGAAGVSASLKPDLSQALRAFAQHEEFRAISPKMALLNIFATLLLVFVNRVSGVQRLALGMPFHNRPSKAFAETIGLFMEICPVQVEIGDDDSFLAVHRKVAESMREVLLHAQHGTGNPIHHRSYDVMLNFQTADYADMGGAAVTLRSPDAGFEDSGLAVTLKVYDLDEARPFDLRLDFNADIFDDRFGGQAAADFEAVVRAFLSDPEQAVGGLSLLSAADRRRVEQAAAKAGRAAARPAAAGDESRPWTPLERQIAEIWRAVRKVAAVGLHDHFFESGGDSLAAVELALRIERQLGRKLPPSVLFEAPTVAELARLIEGPAPTASLVAIQPGGSRPPFFCVHAVTGDVVVFGHLARRLGADQPFYAFRNKPLDGSVPPVHSIEEIAADYIAELRAFKPHGPYHLGGYSFGGYVAYEMARQLRAAGEEVAAVVLIDSLFEPGRRMTPPVEWVKRHVERWRRIPRRQRLGYLLTRLKNLYAIPMMNIRRKRRVRVWRRFCAGRIAMPDYFRIATNFNTMLWAEYRFPPYDGRIAMICAELDATVPRNAHDGWKAVARGGVEIATMPCNHDEIVQEPYVAEVAAIIERWLTAGGIAAEAGPEARRAAAAFPDAVNLANAAHNAN